MTTPAAPAPPPETSSTPEELVRTLAKRELRKRMRGVRKTTPGSRIAERSAVVCEVLFDHPWVQSASSIATFFPIEERHELDLRALHTRLLAVGKKIYYPAIDPETNVMTFRRADDMASLEEQGRGFAEPPHDAEELRAGGAGELVLLVPALALDDAGRRLGYGAGYYDRTLPRFCPPGRTIGVAFAFQLLGELPVHEHDVPVDLVVTDAGAHTPRRGGAAAEPNESQAISPSATEARFERREPGVMVVRRR